MTAARFQLRPIVEFLNARLSKRIVYWVFLSIIAIEAIILVPSVMRRERELLSYLRSLSTAQTLGLLNAKTLSDLDDQGLINYLQRIQSNPVVLGGALYTVDGTQVGQFGEPPALTLRQSQMGRTDRYYRGQSRYDAPWEMPPLQGRYVLIVRHDATWVQREFFMFIARITGLVLIISIFVTGATLYVLRRLVIRPVFQLRQDLLTAGEAIRDDCDTQALSFESLEAARDDELGDVIAAFHQMFGQITEAIATRKMSENRFRTLVEQAADGFFVVNQAGQIIDVNQTACDALGYSREELMALSVADIQKGFTPEDFQGVWQRLQPGVPLTQESWHQRKDGSRFPVEVRLGLLETDHQRYILALVRDITERKASEKAQARLAEIGELAAMIVHEVRSPLTTVLMGLNSFRPMELSERARTRLDLALEESERLQKLLNEILLYSREPSLEFQDIELTSLMQELADTLVGSPSLGRRRLEVKSLDQTVVIRGDRDKLKQVFINLINNACEAAPDGDTVTWMLHAPHPTQIVVSIHNGGEPIPPELLPQLTKPFFTTKSSGNGLGLAITQRIVEAHRGELTITSSPERGTEVTVALPIWRG
ncbi:MAG: nitrogen regulation protein NR(II) [Nodosilinea sp.]